MAAGTAVYDRDSNTALPSNHDGVSTASMRGTDTPISSQSRPTSAPGQNSQSAASSIYQRGTQDDTDTDREHTLARRPKPLLLRAKSDYGPRGETPLHSPDGQDWGARHGFEDHYASEEYVSQLANVRCPFLS